MIQELTQKLRSFRWWRRLLGGEWFYIERRDGTLLPGVRYDYWVRDRPFLPMFVVISHEVY